MKGFSTKAIHTQYTTPDPHGSLNFPIYNSVAFEFESAEAIEKAFNGKLPRHTYSRISNPTIEYFEQKVKNLSNAFGVLALSSGMAAISSLILSITKSRDTIITSKHLFGNTYSLFETTLGNWGLNTKFVDLTDINSVENSIDDTTRAIFIETITNPQLEVVNIKKLADIAKRHKILLIADTTFTPLCFADFKLLGINIEVISSTKYISGGATSVGGLIIDYGNYNWRNNPKLATDATKFGPFTLLMKLRKEVYRNLGTCISPENAYLQSLGLDTLVLRIDASIKNTIDIAEYLQQHSKIEKVNYPGLQSSLYYQIAKKQFGDRTGSLLTFCLKTKDECFKFMNRLQVIRRATNLNDNKTLIIHPASTIYCEYSKEERLTMGVEDTMLRLAVGIEDVEDLLDDINNSLEEI